MSIWSDVRHGARLLVKDRSLSAAAIGAMALAMATVATIATLANGIFFRPLPFDDPGRIVILSTRVTVNANTFTSGVSYSELQDWRAGARTFSDIAGFTEQPINLADDTVAPERLNAIFMTANTLRTIGRAPMLGRDFVAGDDATGAPPVAILGARVWRSRYGADPAIVGRTVRINGEAATVVGVMPDGFGFPDVAEIWQPLGARPESHGDTRRERPVNMVARLAPGVTAEQATADLSRVLTDLAARYPDASRGVMPLVRDFRERSVGRVRIVFTAFGAAAAFVLLLACANVANLLLARGVDRSREITIRLSMGASRRRITTQLLAESLVIGGAAGMLGLGLSVAGVTAFQRTIDAAGGVPYFLDFPIDWRVLTFLVIVSLVSSALFGLVPALQTTRVSLTAILAEGAWTTTSTRSRRLWQSALVSAQVALAIVLLTTAGLMLRDLQASTNADVGIDASAVMTARFLLPETRYPTPDARATFYRRLDTRLAQLPMGAGVLAMYPPSQGAERRFASVDAQPVPRSGRTVSYLSIGPRYFTTLSDRPVRGRELADTDGPGVAVVNERFAELYFGDGDPLGRTVTVAGFPPRNEPVRMTIVGVAPNVRHRSTEDRQFDAAIYVSQAAEAPVNATLIVRSMAGAAATATAMREAMRAIDADLPLFQIASVDTLLEEDRWEGRVLSTVFGLIATLALALAAVGVYGVTAFAVAKRAREIGLRVALGARAAHICALVARGIASPLVAGTVLGLAGAMLLGRALQTLLSEIEPNDTVTLVAVPLVLAAVAAIAGFVPARRALRVNPADALRAE
jgi:putative ABC transport system permease protein